VCLDRPRRTRLSRPLGDHFDKALPQVKRPGSEVLEFM
jgi:hypothetical protein